MALGKTITYTPFQETSFGYGSGEIAAAHATEFPNATDIVKVVINDAAGTSWDATTGHISTPSVGTAVSHYNSVGVLWSCRGERDDVDAVLAQLKLFPSDYSSARTWTPTALKENQTTGTFANEEPPSIPDTLWTLFVYDSSDAIVQSYSVIFEADGPTYGNQRPYWSTEPTHEDMTGISGSTLLDLGTISHGADTENVNVSCVLRDYGTTTANASYGGTTSQGGIYVGDKKPTASPTGLFEFIGSVAETQSYLDNLLFDPSGNTSFDMYLTISDGVVGSEFTKTMYFSKALEASTFPAQSAAEDADLYIDAGSFSFTNLSTMPEVNSFDITITFDSEMASAVSEAYNVSNPLTIVNDQLTWTGIASSSGVLTLLNGLRFVLNTDYNGSFTFDLDITASNSTVGSSYVMATQTVSCSISAVDEYSFTDPGPISWTEDNHINVDTQFDILDTAFGGSATYTVYLRPDVSSGISNISTYGSHGTTETGSGTQSSPLEINGTRTQVNSALAQIRVEPELDYTGSFNIDIKAERDNDSTVFTNYGESVSFAAGTAEDAVTIAGSSGFYETTDVKKDTSATSTVDFEYMSGTTVTFNEELYTGDYTVNFYIPDTFTGKFNISGVDVALERYVDAGYSDDYVYQTFSITANKATLETKLNTMIVYDFTSDFTFTLDFVRGSTTALSKNITMNYQPEITTTYDFGLWNNLDLESNPNYYLDEVIDYTYTGSGVVSIESSTYSSYTDSTKTTATTDRQGQASSDNYTFSIDSQNNHIVIDISLEADSDDVDNEPQYEQFDIIIEQGTHADGSYTVPDVYKTVTANRFLDERHTQVYGANSSYTTYPIWFVPKAYDNVNHDKVVWRGYDEDDDVWENAQTYIGQDYTGSDDELDNSFPYATTGIKVDHLFGAYPYDNSGTKEIRVTETNTTTSTNLNTTAITAGGDSIQIATGWAADATVVDIFFQDNGLKLYVLFVNNSDKSWKLLSLDCDNGKDITTPQTPTVEISSSTTLYAASIAKTTSNEVFVVTAEDDSGDKFKVYHQNQGGSDNWGLKQTITTTSTLTENFTHKSYIDTNTNNYFALGNELYYWNGTTWTNILSDDDTETLAALCKSVFWARDPSDSNGVKAYNLDGSTTTNILTATGGVYTQLVGSKRSDIIARQTFSNGSLISGNTIIYRFAR